MVQKKFNTFQAIFGFVLMYTAIVVGILLREYPFTPIGVAAIAVLVLVMLKFRNKIVPSTDQFTVRWIFMFWLIELSTYLTFYFIIEVLWGLFQLTQNFTVYTSLMFAYSFVVSGLYLGIVYNGKYDRYNSFGLSESFEKIHSDITDCNYKLQLYQFYSLKDHFAFKWLRRLAIHFVFPIASLLGYIAITYKQASKVGYGVAGVLSVITFIFIFRIVWEGRDGNENNKPTLESTGEDTQSSEE